MHWRDGHHHPWLMGTSLVCYYNNADDEVLSCSKEIAIIVMTDMSEGQLARLRDN